jgi:proteasome-associated ATPase
MAWAKKKSRDAEQDIAGLNQRVIELEQELEEAQAGRGSERLLARIADLEAQVEGLRGVREDDQGVVSLRDALMAARDKLQEQDALLRKLTAHPTPYATVVNVRGAETTWTDFVEGVRIRIRRDSRFADQFDGEGVVEGESRHGWQTVKFDSQSYSTNRYRIGRPDVDEGACDLELVNPPVSGVVLFFDGKFIEVEPPTGMNVFPGDTVKVNGETLQIIEVVGSIKHGSIATVVQVLEDETCEINHAEGRRIVSVGRYKTELEKGDRVVLDANAVVIIQNLGKADERFKLSEATNVGWDDIGGLEGAKQALIEAVEQPHIHPELFEFYGHKPPKGVLLYGPPGCGKTMLAKAVATALAKVHNGGQVAPSGYLYVKGPELLSKWVGETEASIRRLFARARAHKAEHGYPAVLFLDEAESLLRRRGSGVSSDVESTIVPMFLAEMDGLEDSAAITLLATNRPDLLDPAVVRDGRVDRKIVVTRPNLDNSVDIFKIHLAGKPFHNGYSIRDLAAAATSELFADHHQLLEVQLRGDQTMRFGLGQIVNGGMIAGVVDKAVSIALQRDLREGVRTGLKPEDITLAIMQVAEENKHLDHRDALSEFVEEVKNDVVGVHRLQAGGLMV